MNRRDALKTILVGFLGPTAAVVAGVKVAPKTFEALYRVHANVFCLPEIPQGTYWVGENFTRADALSYAGKEARKQVGIIYNDHPTLGSFVPCRMRLEKAEQRGNGDWVIDYRFVCERL